MARRRSMTPVPLRPFVGAAKVARRRRARTTRQETRNFQRVVLAAAAGKPVKQEDLKVAPATIRKSKVDRFRYQHRKTLAAAYVAFWVALSKGMVHVDWMALVGMLVAVVLGMLSAFWVRKTSRKPVDWAWLQTPWPAVNERLSPRVGALTAIGAALAWWLLPLPAKPSLWLLALGTGIAVAFRAFRFRVRVLESSPESRESDWQQHVAGDKGPLAGSEMVGVSLLHSPRDDAVIGWSAGIVLPKSAKGATAVTTDDLRGRIANVYDVGRQGVMYDVPRDTERRFVLSVIDQAGGNALDEIHPYTTTDFDPKTGVFTHGIRADWQSARAQAYDPNVGAFHWHVSGMNGAGKSEGIENILRQTTQHGLVVPIFCDLGDLTYTDWKPFSPVWETEALRCLRVLENLCELIKHRQKQMKTMRRYDEHGEDLGVMRVYPISRSKPLVQLIFDEWHLLWGDQTVIGPGRQDTIGKKALELTAFIVGQGRKTMVSALLATQSTHQEHGFGGSTYIRLQCQNGNMIGYRNGETSGGQAFGGEIEVDPSTIPKDRKGTCFLTSPVDARDAMARTIWVREPMKLNHLLDIPDLPADELAILRRGLDEEGYALVSAPPEQRVPEITQQVVAPEPIPVRAPRGPSEDLVFDIRRWVEENHPVRRDRIIDEFRTNPDGSLRASKTRIDEALKVLRESEILASDQGFYSPTNAKAV